MTTDTFIKKCCVKVDIDGKGVIISGIAKGSGMIHPNMATMLNFITTDCNISQEMLNLAFKSCVNDSFNVLYLLSILRYMWYNGNGELK